LKANNDGGKGNHAQHIQVKAFPGQQSGYQPVMMQVSKNDDQHKREQVNRVKRIKK